MRSCMQVSYFLPHSAKSTQVTLVLLVINHRIEVKTRGKNWDTEAVPSSVPTHPLTLQVLASQANIVSLVQFNFLQISIRYCKINYIMLA